METSIYIFKIEDFTEEELEDTPIEKFTIEGKEYGIILCDGDGFGNDNLEEVLEIYLDEKKVKQLAEKIKEKAENIMYLG